MKTEVEPVQLSDLGLWFGRMYPELSAQTKAQTSEPSCKKPSASSAKKLPIFLCLTKAGQQPDALSVWGGDWSVAWRVLDAQFWGVPQRRRRIALIADFGGATAPEILFEREGVSGNITQSEPQRQAFAGHSQASIGNSGTAGIAFCIQGNCIDRADNAGCNGRGWREDKSYTLNTVDRPAVFDARGNGDGNTSPTMTGDHNSRITDYSAIVVSGEKTVAGFKYKAGAKAGSIAYSDERSPTLSAETHDASVITPTGFSQAAYDKFSEGNKTATLKARGGSYGGGSETLIVNKDCKGFPLGFRPENTRLYDEKATTVCSGTRPGYCNGVCMATQQGGAEIRTDDKAQTLTAAGTSGNNQSVYANSEYAVRRLTPLECERLQGFPDGWTDIGDWTDSKGKKHKDSDGVRYKALGNSIAIPPWLYVLSRLSLCCGSDHTMASLFDGIGGFPYIWERLHGKGSCLWASEIEEFPIAVTKIHFPEVEE